MGRATQVELGSRSRIASRVTPRLLGFSYVVTTLLSLATRLACEFEAVFQMPNGSAAFCGML